MPVIVVDFSNHSLDFLCYLVFFIPPRSDLFKELPVLPYFLYQVSYIARLYFILFCDLSLRLKRIDNLVYYINLFR